MGRSPCCDKSKVKRGSWSPEEDAILKNYIQNYGTGGNWIALPHKAGLKRCGKSCRLRWLNYLRPDVKLGGFTEDEECIICNLYNKIGSRWSVIASHLPGRTDNDVKNYWNTKLKKKLTTSMSTDMKTAAVSAAADTATTTGATATSQIAPYRVESAANEPINFDSLGFILEGSSDCSSGGNDVNLPFCPPHFEEGSNPFRSFCVGMDGSEYPWEIVSGIWSEEVVGADVVDAADLFSIFHVDSNF